MKVALDYIVNGLDMVDDVNNVYYVPDSGDIGFVNQEVISDVFENIEGNEVPENAIFLPSRYEIHEYSIMERFVYTLDGEMYEELAFAINGRGAFRNFKHLIHRYNIHENWYDFRERAFIRIAKEWCDSHDIEYY